MRAALVAAAAVAVGGAGCVTLNEKRFNPATDRAASTRGSKAISPDKPLNTPAGDSRNSRVQAELLPLGKVPFDNLSLPTVSPDGQFIATQTGIPPTWPTILAEPKADVPEATSVEIYSIPPVQQIKEGEQPRTGEPQFVAAVPEPVLLGRSCDSQGFLVESQRPGGARWIGLAAWATGEIRWLVSDERVNAFASMGPDGQLAWCRRDIKGEHFELVIRAHEHEWTMPPQDGDWFMPTWSGVGDGLFALHLLAGRLNAVYLIAQSEPALRQSKRTLFLAGGADDFIAYQCLAGQVTSVGVPGVFSQDQFVFLHPAQARMAIWRPMLRNGGLPILLAANSLAAVVDQSTWAIVATDRRLLRQNTLDTRTFDEMMAGTVIPRRISGPLGDFVLLGIGPDTPGQIGLTGMRLAPVPSTAAADERGQ